MQVRHIHGVGMVEGMMLEGKFGDEFLEVQAVMQLVECTTQHSVMRD